MRPLLPLLLLTLTGSAAGTQAMAQQPAQPPCYCTFKGGLFYRAEENPHFKGSLQEYFERELAGHYPATDCAIELKLLIDTAGNACCLSIDHPSADVDTAQLINTIAKMPVWTPGLQNHRQINFSAVIRLSFSHSKLTVTYTNEAKIYPPGFKPPRHT